MAAPRIEYDTDNKAIEFEQEPGGFEVRPISRLGISRAQTSAFKASHFGTEDQIIITETGEDGARLDELMRFWGEFAAKGNSFKVIRDRDLAFYMSFGQRSIKDNNNIAGTFTRALSGGLSRASYYDPFEDKVKFAADVVDTPRFTDGPGGQTDGAILMEDVAANLIDPDLSLAAWVGVGATLTKGTDEIDDPRGLGLFEATKIDLSGTNGGMINTTSVAVAANGDLSIYVKPLTVQDITTELVGTGSGSVIKTHSNVALNGPHGQGWTRLDVGFTGTPMTGDYVIGILGTTIGNVFYVWAPQIETGTQREHPTGFINTQGNIRNKDSLIIQNAETIFNKRIKGTIGFWYRPHFIQGDGRSVILFDVGNSSAEPFMHMEITNASALVITMNDAEGFTRYSVQKNQGSGFIITKNVWEFYTLTWDLTIDNEFTLYKNAVEETKETAQVAFTPKLMDTGSTMAIGSSIVSSFVAMGDFAKFFVRRNVLPLNRIQNLFNLPTHLYEQRNEWPKCILSEPTIEPVQTDGAGRWRFQLIVEEVT